MPVFVSGLKLPNHSQRLSNPVYGGFGSDQELDSCVTVEGHTKILNSIGAFDERREIGQGHRVDFDLDFVPVEQPKPTIVAVVCSVVPDGIFGYTTACSPSKLSPQIYLDHLACQLRKQHFVQFTWTKEMDQTLLACIHW